MKKTRRTILFLESLENRVVPSNMQALLGVDHGAAEASAVVAEMETPPVKSDLHEASVPEAAGMAEAAKSATIWDVTSSSSDPSNLSRGESKEQTNSSDQASQTVPDSAAHSDAADAAQGNSDHAEPGDKSMKNSDEGSSGDTSSSLDATITTSTDSIGRLTADLEKGDSGANVGNKTGQDSENSKAKDSESDHSNSSPANSSGSAIVDPDSVSSSKNNSDISSALDKNDLKSSSSSSNSGSGSGLSGTGSAVDPGDVTGSGTNNSSAKNNSRTGTNSTDSATVDTTGSGTAVSKNSDSTGTTSGTEKANQGKSSSDHKDPQATGNSTKTTGSADGIQSVPASAILANQSKASDTRLTTGSAEANASVTESVAPAAGNTLERDGGAAGFSSVAAILTAKEAGLNLPQVAAIPLAVPTLESLTPLGMGDASTLAAVEGLAPVAGDLIVGFLPVEQVALGPVMQGVLNQIDDLGEQLVGSSAARWLYPFIFTALAATTVYQLASRKRRQFHGQSVWARDGSSWSSTWFPLFSSSIQQ